MPSNNRTPERFSFLVFLTCFGFAGIIVICSAVVAVKRDAPKHSANTVQVANQSDSAPGSAHTKAFSRGVINPVAQHQSFIYSGEIPLKVMFVEEGLGALVALPDGCGFMTNNKEVMALERGAFFKFRATHEAPRMHEEALVEKLDPHQIDFNKIYYTDPFGGQM